MANSKDKPCHLFLRGSCKFGARCKYSHSQAKNQDSNAREGGTRKPIALDGGSEQAFRQWRFMVPKSDTQVILPLRAKLGAFFQQALTLVNQDPGIMQQVVTLLANEGGLQRINELAQQDLDGLFGKRGAEVFSSQIIPLYQVISHPSIVVSAILEQAVGTLYNYLYGINGQRAIKLFSFVVRTLEAGEFPPDNIETCVAVFSQMIDINVNATVNEHLHGPAKAFARLVEARGTDVAGAALDHIERINRRLNLGMQMQLKSSSVPSKKKTGKARFKLDQTPPGGRHDNDSADICSIRIMPTYKEIQSNQTEYLPVNDPELLHLPGLQGLLDRQFRLLREDNVGPLRDAIRSELEGLQGRRDNASGRQRKQLQRTFSYRGVLLTEVNFERRIGFHLTVRFDKPEQLLRSGRTAQGDWWEQSRRLQLDSLVCLLDSSGSVVFCTVGEVRETANKSKNGAGSRVKTVYERSDKDPHAYVTLAPVTTDNMNIQLLLEHFIASQRIGRVTLSLIEFPGVLLPSFQPTLLALQQMQKKGDLPFANFLAPLDVDDGPDTNVPPPAYSLKPGFQFNLRCIMKKGEDLLLNTREQFDIKKLQDGSSLDNAQAVALVDSLSRRLALIQGPPGTGKSYTGVALIKVLLANKNKQTRRFLGPGLQVNVNPGTNIGPIVCVCYTNHALDQLLEHLVKGGVKQVIRIGSRSKSELLAECTLRKVASKMEKTKTEKTRMYELYQALEALEEDLENLFGELARADSLGTIRDHLRFHHPKHYGELFGNTDDEGFEEVRHNKKSVVNQWLQRGNRDPPGRTIDPRPIPVLIRVSLNAMSHAERQALHQFWLSEITGHLFETIKSLLLETNETRTKLDQVRREVDLRCLDQANIIGVTTSGLARNIDLMRRVDAKVMLCEEAGEVLESHTITAFLPSLQHVILIGDHLQLRPQIQNYHLQHDNPSGEKYSLDISLFERLVQPPGPSTTRLPFTTLETQRRMHPSISRLIRDTLYPKLQDSDTVSEYPPVSGLRKRLFWFDHGMPENNEAETVTTSRTNDFEVEMTAALVTHLVRQGVYSSENIAVLTPYLGQLQKLKRRFSSSFEIVLNDLDQDDLQNAELTSDDGAATTAPPLQIAKTSLRNALRLATVDNFQGEEAAVVIISLVRCNKKNNCGFLRTSNRINVLLSRAKHGMYIIGNARTSSHVQMWDDVITILKDSDSFGTSLELMYVTNVFIAAMPVSANVIQTFCMLPSDAWNHVRDHLRDVITPVPRSAVILASRNAMLPFMIQTEFFLVDTRSRICPAGNRRTQVKLSAGGKSSGQFQPVGIRSKSSVSPTSLLRRISVRPHVAPFYLVATPANRNAISASPAKVMANAHKNVAGTTLPASMPVPMNAMGMFLAHHAASHAK
ncbi:hypothetical protein FQN54_005919 [Arachnomyces sp. PD_36]|nr:hypothetical protein FQN54_005919 [Arachnomyces sp. PD_36]